MTPIGSYLFDLPREMEPAIEAIATTTGRSMEEIVRVLLNHAVASNPLCRALTAPRMPDLHLARYAIDIELKRSAVESLSTMSWRNWRATRSRRRYRTTWTRSSTRP